MNNNQIKTPKGMQLNDKDHMNDLLSGLKALEKNYTVAMTEASNENLYQKEKEMFEKITSLQREVYELMFRFGWYPMEKAENTKIMNKYQMLSQELADLQGGN